MDLVMTSEVAWFWKIIEDAGGLNVGKEAGNFVNPLDKVWPW